MPEAFFSRDAGAYVAAGITRGPWDPDSQHAGPPCALLGRELDRSGGIEGALLARATFEILKPVPIGRMLVHAEIVRGGKRVEMVEGTLSHEGSVLIRARGWRIRTEALELDEHAPEPPLLPGPAEAQEGAAFFPGAADVGYHTGMEVRFVEGAFDSPGPARAWMRMRHPLIEGEEIAPRDRVLICADSGNGVSSPLDFRRWVFINTDLSVNLRRLPEGDWVALDAVSYVEPHGTGLSDTMLCDEHGMIGRATQSLLVAAR